MTYSIRLPQDVETRLEKLSNRTGRSKAYYVKEAILEHLADLEDIYLAEKRLTDIRTGRTKTIPLGQIMKRYGMED
jgi:RHH-type rel operon transcriptional repressor/antitoxin RelB